MDKLKKGWFTYFLRLPLTVALFSLNYDYAQIYFGGIDSYYYSYVASLSKLQCRQIQGSAEVWVALPSNLAVSSINIDSYEPNLAICEYLANRCQQSSLNCLRKLNDILTRKLKRNPNRTDCQTESIIKLNIAILFILQGKRDNALVILNDIYHNRDCFIEFMQSRIFLLILVDLLKFRNSMLLLKILWRYSASTDIICSGQSNSEVKLSSGYLLSFISMAKLLRCREKSFCLWVESIQIKHWCSWERLPPV